MDRARDLTPPDVFEQADSKEFLLHCLKSSKLDPELLDDVADACEMHDPVLSAVRLACGELSPEAAGDKLFLMQDEAKALLDQCKHECLKLGVDFGDGSTYVPHQDVAPWPAAAVTKVVSVVSAKQEEGSHGAAGIPNGLHATPALSPEEPKAAIAAPPAAVIPIRSAPATEVPAAAATNGTTAEEPMSEPSTSSKAAKAQAPAKKAKPAPKAAPAPAAAAPVPAPPAATPAPALATALSDADAFLQPSAAAPPEQLLSGGKPGSGRAARKAGSKAASAAAAAPAVAASSFDATSVAAAASSMSAATPRAAKGKPASAAATRPLPAVAAKSEPPPSYARPTASFKSRQSGPEDASDATSEQQAAVSAPAPLLPPVPSPEPEPPVKKVVKKTAFAHISASLLRPTKAFLAWTTGNSKEERDNRASLASSQMLHKGPTPALRNARLGSGSVKLTAKDVEGGLAVAAPKAPRPKSSVPSGPSASASSAPSAPSTNSAAAPLPKPEARTAASAADVTPQSKPHASHVARKEAAKEELAKVKEVLDVRGTGATAGSSSQAAPSSSGVSASAPASRRVTLDAPPAGVGSATDGGGGGGGGGGSSIPSTPATSRTPSSSLGGGASFRSGIPKPLPAVS